MSPEEVSKFLWSDEQPLFVTLDAARGRKVELFTSTEGGRTECLYEGKSAEALTDAAPYLCQIGRNYELLQRLTRAGWGQSAELFLTSEQSFDAVRKHLRKFLTVKFDDGRERLFRFYDPRVLRAFLPVCTQAQLKDFFGPINAFWVESTDSSQLIRFTCARERLEVFTLP